MVGSRRWWDAETEEDELGRQRAAEPRVLAMQGGFGVDVGYRAPDDSATGVRCEVDERGRIAPEQLGVQHDNEGGAVGRVGQVGRVAKWAGVSPNRLIVGQRYDGHDVGGDGPGADVDPLPEPPQRCPTRGDRQVAPAELPERLVVGADQHGINKCGVRLHRENAIGGDVAGSWKQPVRRLFLQELPQG